eukprot:11404814-Alexandrium_andersonii.AAC.1
MSTVFRPKHASACVSWPLLLRPPRSLTISSTTQSGGSRPPVRVPTRTGLVARAPPAKLEAPKQ